MAQQEATQYFIVTQLFVTANGRSELSRTDKNHRLLKQDTKNQKKKDVANNPHLALPAKASKRLYTEVLAAPNNSPYTHVNKYTLCGAKLG